MRHFDLFSPGECDPATFGFNGRLAMLCLGGGAHAPPAPVAPIAPPAAETPTNTPQANLMKRQGLQSTLLTGGGSAAQAGTLLGGSSAPLGASIVPPTFGPQFSNGGQN
jgi:hypothetical protein